MHIGRQKSVDALEAEDVVRGRKQTLLVTQKRSATDLTASAWVLAAIAQRVTFDDGSNQVD